MEQPTAAMDYSLSASATGFDTFFRDNHIQIVRALGLTLGDADLGRDAAAEGFARALQRWSKVAKYANPAGWVYRVGLNWARSRRRRSRREQLGVTIEGAAPSVPLRSDELIRALRELSLDHRTVVVGRYYLDWSEAQLAAALDIAPGTVKSRLSRALAQLAELLQTPIGTPIDPLLATPFEPPVRTLLDAPIHSSAEGHRDDHS